MPRSYVCDECGTPGIQLTGGKKQKRCDRCRAGSGGNAPRKRDLAGPPAPRPTRSTDGALADATRPGGGLTGAVRADLDALITQHPMAEGLRALALTLAVRVEDAEDKTVASLARELRSTLEGLASYEVRRGEDDDDDVDLSASVLDPPQP